MFFLPQNIISKIYEYDDTYHKIYKYCIKTMFIIYIDLNREPYSCPINHYGITNKFRNKLSYYYDENNNIKII